MNALTQEKCLTEDEYQKLLKILSSEKGTRNYFMILMLLYSGARSCEALQIKKKHLDNTAITIFGRKNSNDRTVPLPPKYYKELQAYTKNLTDDELLFPITGRMCRKIWSWFRPNKNKGVHCLRHTLGVRLYGNCENIHVVKTVLGHKSITNTMIYLEFVETDKKLKSAIKGMW